jgi:hypothetical protein
MAESATLNDWPSSATAPYLVLTAEELEALADAPFWTHQRVSAPHLTVTEQAALKQSAKEAMELGRKAFSRGPLDKLCQKLRAADATCDVLRNPVRQ